MNNVNEILVKAKELLQAREKATQGEWKTQPEEYVAFIGEQFFSVIGGLPDKDGDLIRITSDRVTLENAEFITLAANHITEICQALIELADEDGKGPLAQWKRQYLHEWGKKKQLGKENQLLREDRERLKDALLDAYDTLSYGRCRYGVEKALAASDLVGKELAND